jgi:hypothetical protein
MVRAGAGGLVPLTVETAGLSALPPQAWRDRDFAGGEWSVYADGGSGTEGLFGARTYRREGNGAPVMLCLRSAFELSDPDEAPGLEIKVEYVGGIVAYLNGAEIGRDHVRAGTLEPFARATDYAGEVYRTADGAKPLPFIAKGETPPRELLDRYRQRVRTLRLPIPPEAIVKGKNVLAIELRRSRVSGSEPEPGLMWWHAGLGSVELMSR